MEKYVRVYYSSFIDVPVVEENFSTEEEMIEWAKENADDSFSAQEITDNATKDDSVSPEIIY